MFNGSEAWLPLKHIRVADFTRVIAGPTCPMLLAGMGAMLDKGVALQSPTQSR
jgi:crotonobetainyl-CoA:carnitine CoA-transferase CaiB-like acyl-CoA transferase